MWMLIAAGCVPRVVPASMPTGAPEPAGGPWTSAVASEAPLVGRIWHPATRRWATEEELMADLRTVPLVLLGEKHDNPDHHRLQARLVAALAPASCVMEMLDDADPVSGVTRTQELAAASAWDSSGWPPFVLYQPIVEACYQAGATIVAGHPTRLQLNTVRAGGLAALAREDAAGLPPSTVDAAGHAALASILVAAHCGHLPEDRAVPMAQLQATKDAWMARALLRSRAPDRTTVLIAGNGHTDTRFGVPKYLGGAPSRTVAWVEVQNGAHDPSAYSDVAADWVWFTPRVDDLDPCAAFAE